ncbi:DNA replication/repair protein RecF [Pasteurella atlantica]|uniref:DNA replication/repair protein RecF n=1 Tax=Pasteurellaceae TaxID=712 RepID=UPI00275E8F26|nr:DNA replication/repair protein RecF [Pasteurella atlantica]MDP8033388.1 DNA replication/repair protein RecF [Pasteurella atlantica]MDP8035324.1 DNA replication/repair protein RecF [Pasteurella atlantica]MDP8037274.1 DNA replication/repair protein RecF [Pasteurella atlantica]MDP8047612.1 DNA replication/repair protein RecF [Pasteurella atlantica]MDP8049577.1 DNA replication/repair protein RecF [Pasteurella atlantica]
MPLSRLIINNFRNLNAVDLELSHGFNFLVGENGSGKTSLLEAIFYLGHGRSFKSNITNRIINYESEHFILHGKIDEAKYHWSVGLQRSRQNQTILKINGEDGNKMADLAHLLPMQVIMPEGLTLLNGGPSYRRAYLDWGLFHLHTHFYTHWTNLKRLLKQRNAALPQIRYYQELLHWDKELVNLALVVSKMRAEYAEILCPEIEKTCQFFLPELEISATFYQGWNKDQDYATILAQGFERDKSIGYTMIGPQKADFRFRANGLPVEDVLSRGQLKLLMCALRLAQGEHLIQQKECQCLFLIDDFASELDANKRELLTHRLRRSNSQVFITAINKEQLQYMDWQKNNTDKLFTVKNGNIRLLSPK